MAPSVSPPFNQKKGGVLSKITYGIFSLTEKGLLSGGGRLFTGVFNAGLGVPYYIRGTPQSATGGGGLKEIHIWHDLCHPPERAALARGTGAGRGRAEGALPFWHNLCHHPAQPLTVQPAVPRIATPQPRTALRTPDWHPHTAPALNEPLRRSYSPVQF